MKTPEPSEKEKADAFDRIFNVLYHDGRRVDPDLQWDDETLERVGAVTRGLKDPENFKTACAHGVVLTWLKSTNCTEALAIHACIEGELAEVEIVEEANVVKILLQEFQRWATNALKALDDPAYIQNLTSEDKSAWADYRRIQRAEDGHPQ